MSPLIDLRLPADLADWRHDVAEFLAAEMDRSRTAGHADPADLTGLDEDFERAHQIAAAGRGYLGISVPVEEGGSGRPRSWKCVYDLEAAYHGAPSIDTGVTLCGTPLSQLGTPEQKQRWLAPMLAGEMMGAIAYSEPGAGNDLSAISTVAEPSGSGWVLSGRKALVTGLHKADVAIVLALTDASGPPRRSMSMFLVPLDATGVSSERRPTLNRWTLGELNLTAVELGADAVLGEVGRGWPQVMAAVAAERGSLAHLGWAARRVEQLPEGVDPRARARLHVGLSAVRRFSQRIVDLHELGRAVGYEASVTKVVATEFLQLVARVGLDAAKPEQSSWAPLFATGPGYRWDALEWIHPTISVGANETHRDMLAAELLESRGSLTSEGGEVPDRVDDPLFDRCAGMARAGREVLELAVVQSLDRPLYGQNLADFQVARHRLVDMFIAVESMELSVAELAAVVDRPRSDYHRSVVKVACNDALYEVLWGAHQLCGGDGYLASHPLAKFTESALDQRVEGGTTAAHLDRIAELIS